MSFRDDREAAHQRADHLERELKRTQDELARLKDPSRRRSGSARAGVVIAAAVTAATLVTGGVFWSVQRVEAQKQEARALALRAQATEDARSAEAEQARALADAERAADQHRREVASAAAATAAAEAIAATTAARITWHGVVGAATGVALAADTPCTIEGSFTPTPGGNLRGLTITCGGQPIYRGSSSAGVSLREGAVFGGTAHEYMLRYADEVSPTRVTLSTLQHTATVWREGDDAMRVTIYVRDVSDAREGESLERRSGTRAPSFAGAVAGTARVTAVRGRAPVAAGARCAFEVRSVWEFPENCRMALRCGTTWLYGAGESGYLTCEVPAGRPVGALDENTTAQGGDPRVTWRGRRLTVSDFTEAGEWAVDLAL